MFTTRAIARDGGWSVHAPTSLGVLCAPYRHHRVTGRSGPDVYVLPEHHELFAEQGASAVNPAGKGIPRGTVIWVHNINAGGHAVGVRDWSSTFWFQVDANTSSAFCAMPGGYWAQLFTGTGKAHTRGPDFPDGAKFTIDLRRSQNNVNLLAEAVESGYDGTVPALVRVTVFPGVVLGSTNRLVAALDAGGDTDVDGVNWASGTKVFLVNAGTISGKGGDGGGGGIGGTGASAGIAGEAGGLALRAPVSIVIDNIGTIQGGGGGGGGGDGSAGTPGRHGGGGGGGAGARIDLTGTIRGGAGGIAATGAVTGADGTLFVAGPAGVGSLASGTIGGSGGNGGAPATGATAGKVIGNGSSSSSGTAGAAGNAISRASGATVSFITAGTVTGSTVVA